MQVADAAAAKRAAKPPTGKSSKAAAAAKQRAAEEAYEDDDEVEQDGDQRPQIRGPLKAAFKQKQKSKWAACMHQLGCCVLQTPA